MKTLLNHEHWSFLWLGRSNAIVPTSITRVITLIWESPETSALKHTSRKHPSTELVFVLWWLGNYAFDIAYLPKGKRKCSHADVGWILDRQRKRQLEHASRNAFPNFALVRFLCFAWLLRQVNPTELMRTWETSDKEWCNNSKLIPTLPTTRVPQEVGLVQGWGTVCGQVGLFQLHINKTFKCLVLSKRT